MQMDEDGPVTRARSRSGSRGRRALGEIHVNAAGVATGILGKKGSVVRRVKGEVATVKTRADRTSFGSGATRSRSRDSGTTARGKGKRKGAGSSGGDTQAKRRKSGKREASAPSAAEIHASLMVEAPARPAAVGDISTGRSAETEAYRDYFNPDLHQYHLDLESTEEYQPVPLNFLTENGLKERMRAIIVDWMVESAGDLKMDNSTMALAVSIFDRSLAKFCTPRSMLPCLASACLLVAGKIEMIYPPAVEDLYYLTDQGNASPADRTFGPEDVITYEGKVCSKLGWRINFVTVQHFRVRLVEAAKLNKREAHLLDYLLDLALLDARCSAHRPSRVAAACLYLVIRTFRRGAAWTRDLAFYSAYEASELRSLVEIVHSKHAASEEASNRAIFTKYRSSARDRTSLVTALRPDQLFA